MKVYIVETAVHSGYAIGASYVNKYEHEIVAVYTDRSLAVKHARYRNHQMMEIEVSDKVPLLRPYGTKKR